MFFSSVLLWIGCVFVYLASPHQKLVETPLSRKVSYIAFSIFLGGSWIGFNQTYSILIAGLIVLTLVMIMWVITVLLLGHIKIKLAPYLMGGSVVSFLLSQLGGVS